MIKDLTEVTANRGLLPAWKNALNLLMTPLAAKLVLSRRAELNRERAHREAFGYISLYR